MSAPRPIPGRDQQQQQQQPPSLQALAVWQPSVPNMSPPKSANVISGPLELKTRDPLPLLPPVPSASYPALTRTGSGRRVPPGTASPTLRHQGSNPTLRNKTSQPSLRGGVGGGGGGTTNQESNYNNNNIDGPRSPIQSASSPSSSFATPDQSPLISNARSYSPAQGTPPTSARSGGAGGYNSSYNQSPSISSDNSATTNLMPPSQANSSYHNHHNIGNENNTSLQRSNSRVQYTSPLFRSSSRASNNPNNRSALSSPALSPSSSPGGGGGGGGLRRQGSILKNAPKDAPYLHANRTAGQLENLTQSWEPSPLQQQHHHQ
ncbi:hypothetical protein BGW42_001849, partial [Actinomortierella wolfii]